LALDVVLRAVVHLVLRLLLHHVEQVHHVDKLLQLFYLLIILLLLLDLLGVWLLLTLP
jgi:hypothetical protein